RLDPYLRIFHKICRGVRRSPFRPALSPFLSCGLVDQEIVQFLATFDRGNKPARSCATACPSLAGRTTISGRDFPSFQCAHWYFASWSGEEGNCPVHSLQLLLKLGMTLRKQSLNPFS